MIIKMASDIENIIQKLEGGNIEEIEKYLQIFNKTYGDRFTFVDFEKDNIQDRIWVVLYHCLSKPQSAKMYELCLLSIRILSRDKLLLEKSKIINDKFINVLLHHAALRDKNWDKINNENVVIEALKCLSNLIYNSSKVQLICCENGILDGILRRLRTYPESKFPHLVKFFDMKLLFLVSALVPDVRLRLKNEYHAISYLTEALDFILKQNIANSLHNIQPRYPLLDVDSVNLACEILKVLFNLTTKGLLSKLGEDDEESCLRLITILREFILASTPPSMHDTLCSNVINLLVNMPVACLELLMPQESVEYNSDALNVILSFFSRKLSETPEPNLFDVVSPTLTLLTEAARNHKIMRRYIRRYVLPPLELANIKQRPEQEETIRGKLVRILTSVHANLRDLVAEFLFILCKENVNRMIKYTGFGNAAGMFAQRGLLAAGRDSVIYSSDSAEDSDTEEYKQFKDQINPVTGAYESPRPRPSTSMTEEQQEYEAMKLVNLMDKLSRDGLVQPCRIGKDGKPYPVDHILQLQEELPKQNFNK